MNVGSAEGEDEVVSTINTTPLVDVMLVLLIIFLITIPVVTTSIPVQLPKETNEVRETKPENIVISVDQKGGIYWNELRIANTDCADRPPEEDLRAQSRSRKCRFAATAARSTTRSGGSFMPASGRASPRSDSSPNRPLAADERTHEDASWQ